MTSLSHLYMTQRITDLRDDMLSQPRYVSIEQALIITKTYRENEDKPTSIRRALSLKNALSQLAIAADPKELVVGNRTCGVRYGVVFPESGSAWVDKEFETLPTRPQDKFLVKSEDIEEFRSIIKPYWQDRSLEDVIRARYGSEIDAIAKVVKINQKDHAQGHICPNCAEWLKLGVMGIKAKAEKKLPGSSGVKKNFWESVVIVMEGVQEFILRYAQLLENMGAEEMAKVCRHLAYHPPETFHQAVQSVWFLFVVLHMESNASSFSPGRLDRALYPYYQKDIENGLLDQQQALEIIECLWLKFNQIVYLRNSHSAKYFAGFPIGFNIAIGGQDHSEQDTTNTLSYLFLKAQEHLGLPQPNLSVRLHKNTPEDFLKQAVRVVAKGSGMPQFFNDQSVIPAMIDLGIEHDDAMDYAIVGCVELTTQGNNLGWSDAAMFNMNKALELTLNNGRCLLTGEQIAPDLGSIVDYADYEALEKAFEQQIRYHIQLMVKACEQVERAHIDVLPSPFLSAVIDDCIEKGMDVTAGGAKYNLSGIQMIQIANLADSLAAIKLLVYDEQRITKEELLKALQSNFQDAEIIRVMLLNKCPKYGNDVAWVDEIGAKWARFFKKELSVKKNYRGGIYHTGMYTVSEHVPMGENVGASPDGRFSREPLADGGMSPVYGRDMAGPTAVLKSVSLLDNELTTNGGLLNMKFLPEFFSTETGVDKFAKFLQTFVDLEIPHIQFNVLRREDLIQAQKNPEKYSGLTVRVAGYTAYFTELAYELQNEIIARTAYGEL